jgi:hypothetical protein
MPDDYQAVWYLDQDKQMFDMFTLGRSIVHEWKPPTLILADPEQQHLTPPDFPALEFHFLIASERAWSVLRPHIGRAVEVLPINHPSGKPFVALNVTRVIDCLVVDRCKTNRLLGDPNPYFSKIFTYAFNEEVVRHEHLFRCPQMKAFEIYGSAELKQLVQENKLIGLQFIKIYPPLNDRTESAPPGNNVE